MKLFRTELKITPSRFKIGLKSPVLTTGSCFADAIGNRLRDSKFHALVNPFGTTYNPVSIHKALSRSILNEPPTPESFVNTEGIYLNYDFHSSCSSAVRRDLENQLSNLVGAAHHFLVNASTILITYGTAWVYHRRDTDEIVANCHKIPQKNFQKSLLTENDVLSSFTQFYNLIRKLNPGVSIILTLSPVRHLKDTLELNSVSKSILRTACHSITQQFQSVYYFPAYEIMLDDLRDYRFYKADMIHPTEEAEDYIWERFTEQFLDGEAIDFIKTWNEIRSALSHRPFHPASESHQRFLKQIYHRLQELKTTVNVDAELATIQSQLTH